MKRSDGHILTTHTGSLPRPPEILAAMRAREEGALADEAAFEVSLANNVAGIVARQVRLGIDIVNDGECGKPTFNSYQAERLSGYERRVPPGGVPVSTGPLSPDGRDAKQFPDFYQSIVEHNPFEHCIRVAPRVCVGPVAYVGQAKLQRDIDNLRSALVAAGGGEAFIPATSPIPDAPNEYYASEDDYAVAYGDAMRAEYQAIPDAGFVLQIDDPHMLSSWDKRREWTVPEFRAWAAHRVELLNHALRGLPSGRVRYHTCYGVNCGPRVSDLQLDEVIDILFSIDAGAYSFEAANPRHEHEWRVFETRRAPEGKILIPGAVTHSNPMIEHPQTVADRIERWARVAGRENIIAGNDCGFASTAGNAEIPMTVAWAKLEALAEGARIASQRLWPATRAA